MKFLLKKELYILTFISLFFGVFSRPTYSLPTDTSASSACCYLFLEEENRGKQCSPKDAVLQQCIKTILLKKSNILVSRYYFNALVEFWRKKEYTFETPHELPHVYETKSGLLHISWDSATLSYIEAWELKEIDFDVVSNKKFNIKELCNMLSNSSFSFTYFYFAGHGFFPKSICGLSPEQFKLLVNHLLNTTQIKQLVCLSCFTYPERILKLLERKTLACDLITATNTHEPAILYITEQLCDLSYLSKTYWEPFIESTGITNPRQLAKILATRIHSQPTLLSAHTTQPICYTNSTVA